MKARDVIERVRILLKDSPKAKYPSDDKEMLPAVVAGMTQVADLRGDVLISATGDLVTWSVPTSVDDTLCLADAWKESVALAAAAHAMVPNLESKAVQSHYGLFQRQLGICLGLPSVGGGE
jgi:hypothetical protein